MAWFVVVSGFLLMAGGAASLLSGFDIVTTERGAAMAIGGVVALSGGVVAVGIGLALVSLKQILRSLEARAPNAQRPLRSDRPVVPLQAEPAAAAVDAPPVPTGVAAVGAAAAVAAAAIETEAARPPPVAARPAPADLEDELTRALAEADEAPEPDRSFAQGPNQLLDRDRERMPAAALADSDVPSGDDLAPSGSEAARPADDVPQAADGDRDTALPGSEAKAEENRGVPPADAEDIERADFEPAAAGDGEDASAGIPDPAPDAPHAMTGAALTAVLGTYSVGGRTYRMFADGSVEAATELGVERFASMEELRKHLAAT